MQTVRILSSLIALALITACTTVQMRHPDFGRDCIDLRPNDDGNTNVDCVTVFYGTNRTVLTSTPVYVNDERDTRAVSPDDADTLSLGRADVWLPKLIEDGGTRDRGDTPQLKGDMPEDDSELSKYVFLTRITANGKDRFITDLQDATYYDGDDSILLFIHGFNVEFEPALIRAAQLSTDLSRDGIFNAGTPVLFSWPSNGKMSMSYYMSDRDRSAAAAPHLEAFLDILTKDIEIDRINIIAHSMGNRVLTKALEAYARDYLSSNSGREIEFRIILAAADVDSDIFDQTTGVLDNLGADVTIYTSDKDRALQVSSILNQARRLGDTNGNRPYIRENDRYQTVDATGVATELFGLGHGYYSTNPFVLGDMLCTLMETDPNDRALQRRRYADDPNLPEYFQVDAAKTPSYQECSLVRETTPNQNPKLYFASKTLTGAGPPPAMVITQPAQSVEMTPPGPPVEPLTFIKSVTLYYNRETYKAERYEDQIVEAIGDNDLLSVTIRAHTDSVGTAAENIARSQALADEMRALFLDRSGLSEDAINTEALGETELQIPTRDGFPASANRRIELLLTLSTVDTY